MIWRAAAAALTVVAIAATGCGGGPPAGWAVDLETVDVELARRHADMFHTVAPAEWAAEVDRLRDVLPGLADSAAALELQRLVARVGDGHTRVVADGLLTRYPVELVTVSDGVAVAGAAPGHAGLAGALVTEIAGVPVEDVVAAAAAYVSAENDVERRRRALGLAISPEFLAHAFGEAGPPVLRRGEALIAPHLAPLPTARWLAEVRGLPAEPYSWERRGAAIVVRYELCADDPDRPFNTELSPPGLRRRSTTRRSTAGSAAAASTSAANPFAPLLAGLIGHRLDHPDRLFALVGARTFSSAVLNAASLDAATSATLVGEPTGGAVNGYGEIGSFTLPHSGLVVEHSTRYFDVVDGPGDTLAPDVVIVPSSADLVAGADPVLEWALGE